METFTKSTPRVRYFSRFEACRENITSRSIIAAKVIAAGSVTMDPNSGTTDKARK